MKIINISILIILLVLSVTLLENDMWGKTCFKQYPYENIKKSSLSVVISSFWGLKSVTADFLWMNVVQYIGDKENASNQYSKFYSMAKEIVSIDPNFTYMYLAGSAIMMWDTKQVDEAVEFVQEGIKNNPTYWPLNLYLAAFTYSKANKFRHLVSTIETAVKMDGHPPMLERILGNLYVKLSEIESKNTDFWLAKAKNLWLDILYNSSDKANIQYAKEHLEKFKLQTTDNRL